MKFHFSRLWVTHILCTMLTYFFVPLLSISMLSFLEKGAVFAHIWVINNSHYIICVLRNEVCTYG